MTDYNELRRLISAKLSNALPTPSNGELAGEIADAIWEILSPSVKGTRRVPVAMACEGPHGAMFIACDDSTIWESNKYGMKFYGRIPQGKVS